MTDGQGTTSGGAGTPRRRAGAGVLADRIAASLVHHEPGWRLPRLTALARRYQATTAEVDAALEELAARQLLRRLPDGQVYRASPAEYRIPLEGLVGLASHVDPMGGHLARRNRQVLRRRPPESVGRSLRLRPGEPVMLIRCLWTVGGEPAALSASYVPEPLAPALADLPALPLRSEAPENLSSARSPALSSGTGPLGLPRAVQIELAPPPPSVARLLRVPAAEQVATVTVCFENPATHEPIALTTAMLRPGMFRLVVQVQGDGVPGGARKADEPGGLPAGGGAESAPDVAGAGDERAEKGPASVWADLASEWAL